MKETTKLLEGEQTSLLHWHGETTQTIERDWLVKFLLETAGIGLMVGESQVGKTFVLMDLALSVMTMKLFAGYRVMRKGGVLWIASEARRGIPLRLRGLEVKLGETDLFKNTPLLLPFCWYGKLPQFLKGAEKEFLDIAKLANIEMQERFGLPLALIIVDSLAKAGGWKSENDAAETGEALAILERVCDELGCFGIATDHPGRDLSKGARGSTAKRAAVDTELHVYGDRHPDDTFHQSTHVCGQAARG
jgi:RecA-family ATPase